MSKKDDEVAVLRDRIDHLRGSIKSAIREIDEAGEYMGLYVRLQYALKQDGKRAKP